MVRLLRVSGGIVPNESKGKLIIRSRVPEVPLVKSRTVSDALVRCCREATLWSLLGVSNLLMTTGQSH